MKGKDLYEAIGSISQQHVTDTLQYFRMQKRLRFVKIGSIAAALCLIVTISVLIAFHGRPVSVNENGFLIQNGELIKYTGEDTDVVIPETVSSIADNAFAEANAVQSVTLTANVKQVGSEAFSCEKGVRLLLSSDNPYFIDTGEAILSKDGTNFLQYIGSNSESYQIPAGVKQIGAFAFYEVDIDDVVFPDGLEYIGKGAFSRCTLRAVNLPDSVTYIGERAFSQCIRAVDGTVPDEAEIGTDAFFQVPFYTSILAGHPCPGEEVQRGTITPSEAFVQSEHLQIINEEILLFIQTGYMRNYNVGPSKTCFPDYTQKIEITQAEFIDGTWGEQIECRAKIYVTDRQYVSIGFVCQNLYDSSDWKDIEWSIGRAEFYPDTYMVQKDDIVLTFFRDADTLNYVLREISYNGRKYDTAIERAVLYPYMCEYGLQKITDGLYILQWDTYENTFSRNLYNYGNTSRGYTDYQVAATLTAIDLRGGELKFTHYLNEIEGYSFSFSVDSMQEDGLYKLLLRDYNYLFIDWVKYLDGEGGITLYEFDTVTIDDVLNIDRLQKEDPSGLISYTYEIEMLQAFITKDTAALEQYSNMPEGTYDLYKTLEFGEYTITQILSGSDLYYQGHIHVFLDVEVVKSDIPEIPIGKHCFVVRDGPGGIFVTEKKWINNFNPVLNVELWEFRNFVSMTGGQEIPDLGNLTEEELKIYKEKVIVYLVDNKFTGSATMDEVITCAKKLFNLTVTENDIRAVKAFMPTFEDDRIFIGGHGGSTVGMDILERKDFGDTITLTIRYYAEGSYTIPAKDVKYTLTKTPYGLAFLTPSETIRDYGREVWGYSV